ncbi:hypothetical protein KY290_005299 [Solanum tuberosum]|uniref:Uncharacterized protein n=1 Tax=Solanum tuberosum TaxID=4113 RepID=A0ABQ7WDP6_SOLTU|nr:hypothetical protein KY289_005689 [Solanum tuberosum]KAH0778872.1 hypothetical protein KY290_005299 [Solanum tuberosum]
MGEVVVSSEGDLEVIGREDMVIETEVGGNMNKNKETWAGSAVATSSSILKWESFLPEMVFRVLLVEIDDSTRQIVAALLRKCNYRLVFRFF